MKYALALSGGGMKGAYQLGSIIALLTQNIEFSFVSGTSVGALNGSLVAQNKVDQLQDFWDLVQDNGYKEIWESWLVKEVNGDLAPKIGGIAEVILTGKLRKLTGLGNLGPLKDKLRNVIKKEDFIIPSRFGLTSLTEGKYFSIDPLKCSTDEDIVNTLLASATMPVIWNPVTKMVSDNVEYTQLVDGGIQSITPIKEAIDYINEQEDEWTLIVVTCSTNEIEPHPEPFNLIGVVGRSLEMMLNQIFQSDLDRFTLINELTKGNGQLGKYRYIPNMIIQPSKHIGSTLDSSSELIAYRRNLGYQDTIKQLAK